MELYKLTVHECIDLLNKKEITSTELTQSVLDRIEKVESKTDAILTKCEENALNVAKEADKLISSDSERDDMTGIPFVLKDNIITKGIKTTCASKMLENFVPPYDATVVDRLKQKSAVLIGKTNLDEFAMGSSTENSAFKVTRNPWDTDRVPGGSSGGSAAAVAADEAYFALGSDTGGSIRQPASYCGIVGMKPTYGSVSRYGLVASASSLDQIGPLSKDVEDCAIILNSIAGEDQRDSTSAKVEHPDFRKALKENIKGLKIGVPKEYFGNEINPEVRQAVLKSIELLKQMGADYQEFSLPSAEYALSAFYIISSAEASSNLARFDGVKYGFRAEKYDDLLDLYNQTRSLGFGDEVKKRIIFGTYVLSSGYYDAYYLKALKARTLIKQDFDRAFENYDVIICPTSPTTAFKLGEKNDNPMEMYMQDICTISLNMAGLPGISIPCGFDSKGLPVGMQIVGKPFDEYTLIKTAYAFEQATDFHKHKPSLV